VADPIYERGLGYLEDFTDDGRDHAFADLVGADGDETPFVPGFADKVVAIHNQLRINSCVSNAGFGAIQTRRSALGHIDPHGARLWGYYLAKADIGIEDFDFGSQIRGFFRSVNHFGFLAEKDYKYGYDTSKHATPPPPLAYHRAIDQKTRGDQMRYRRIFEKGAARVLRIKQALAKDMPVVFGTDVSRDFVRGILGTVVHPPIDIPLAGGHAMYLVDYDAERDAFLAVSSWGTGFGDGGMVWLSASYLAWEGTRDLWVVEWPAPYMTKEAA
jgi:hypothetical protein